jgi:hypothetical protein
MKQFNQRGRVAAAALTKMLVVMCAVGIAGCTNGDVSKVKSQPVPTDTSLTIGQAFDNRKVCDSVKWDAVTDTRGRKLVEYRCFVKDGAALLPANANPVVTVGEVFQWNIDVDGAPTLAYVGSEVTHADGHVDDQVLNPNAVMRLITEDKVTTAADWSRQYAVYQYQ